ncbi:MAG: hypothetical protein RIQ79_1146, partial [Verrucomicrobiota bacterium]
FMDFRPADAAPVRAKPEKPPASIPRHAHRKGVTKS